MLRKLLAGELDGSASMLVPEAVGDADVTYGDLAYACSLVRRARAGVSAVGCREGDRARPAACLPACLHKTTWIPTALTSVGTAEVGHLHWDGRWQDRKAAGCGRAPGLHLCMDARWEQLPLPVHTCA